MKQDSSPEIAAIKEIYAALNRNDVPAFLRFFDPQVERFEPEGFPSSGVYHGLAEFEAHFIKARSTWAEGGCHPEGFAVAGDKIVVYVHVHVRLKDKTEWIDAHIADGFIFRNGKAIQMRTFVEVKDALKWAGIQASP